MNEAKERKIIQEKYNSQFSYDENKSNVIISFERIFFIL